MDFINQMATMTAAMRMLLSNDPIAKPDYLQIAGSNGLTDTLIEMMMLHAGAKRSTFLALFRDEEDTLLLEKVMIADGSTNKREINILCGMFIQKPDGSFAILSHNRDAAYEYSFGSLGRRLIRRAADGRGNRAIMELQGLRALIDKAATPECQREAAQRTIYPC